MSCELGWSHTGFKQSQMGLGRVTAGVIAGVKVRHRVGRGEAEVKWGQSGGHGQPGSDSITQGQVKSGVFRKGQKNLR